MANTYAAAAPPAAFTDLYDKFKEKFTAETPLMEYNPQSDSSIRAKLAAALRPAYDQQIAARQKQTQQARAGMDADAAARGMGASTWLTDAKTRLGNAEASDVSALNGNYISTLASQLLSKMASQESNRLSVEQYNATQRKSAQDRAYQLALGKYQEWAAEQASGGTGGNGGGGKLPELNSTTVPGAAKEIANLVNAGKATGAQADALKRKASTFIQPSAMTRQRRQSGVTM